MILIIKKDVGGFRRWRHLEDGLHAFGKKKKKKVCIIAHGGKERFFSTISRSWSRRSEGMASEKHGERVFCFLFLFFLRLLLKLRSTWNCNLLVNVVLFVWTAGVWRADVRLTTSSCYLSSASPSAVDVHGAASIGWCTAVWVQPEGGEKTQHRPSCYIQRV